MEILVLDLNLNLKGITDNNRSVIWTRKYNELGNFEIHAPLTDNNLALYRRNNVVWKRGAKEAGIIESVQLSDDVKSTEMVIKGRFLEVLLDWRVLLKQWISTTNVESALYSVLQDSTKSTPIPNLYIAPSKGYDETLKIDMARKSILTAFTKVAQAVNFGFRIYPDIANHKYYFECYKGLDKTRNQHDRPFVEFSESFNNLANTKYLENSQLERNVCYVLGEGESNNRACEMVFTGSTEPTGFDRKEFVVDARDLQKDEGMTDADYSEKLVMRGKDKLAENVLSVSFESDTRAQGNFVYKQDYDLGDIVTIKKEAWGVSTDSRITEVMEIYEHEEMEVALTFGNPLPRKLSMED